MELAGIKWLRSGYAERERDDALRWEELFSEPRLTFRTGQAPRGMD